MSLPEEKDPLLRAVRQRSKRRREEGPSVASRLAQIGVLGWIIVVPMLIGLFIGHWLDRLARSGVFWTAPLLLIGLAFGCWSAWKWVQNTR